MIVEVHEREKSLDPNKVLVYNHPDVKNELQEIPTKKLRRKEKIYKSEFEPIPLVFEDPLD